MKIDNEMYFRKNIQWWDDDENSINVMLRHFVNPVRFDYFMGVIKEKVHSPGIGKKMLDLGCGGGFLSEEFAKAGFQVTGIDPAPPGIDCAREHALKSGLSINYVEGYGERLPFENSSFDYVVCCDVLEHIYDLDRVINEISRVLSPGGMFFFDTINRNLKSYLLVIKIAQDWEFTAWEAPRTHDWKMFVKPSELSAVMKNNGLIYQACRGISSGTSLFVNFRNIRERAQSKISRYEMGKRIKLHESNDISVSYMGYGVKKGVC